jgi:nicotinate-nucleotide pyrophosphorylase (carboxylating)
MEQKEIDRIIEMSLIEDIGAGDITSNITIPDNSTASFAIRAREEMVVCGTDIAALVFSKIKSAGKVATEIKKYDGEIVKAGDILLSGHGDAKSIMAGERVALNLLRQMCGVATITREYTQEIKGFKAKLLDTRKTIPGLRSLQKYAVKTGGGQNHRIGLYDGILIKDNHIAICRGIENALKSARAKAPQGMKIEIECDTIEQLKESLEFGADMVLLDNMSIAQLEEAVKITSGRIPLEASGGVNLKTIRNIAKTGVDFISVGSITNNPANVDIGLDISF